MLKRNRIALALLLLALLAGIAIVSRQSDVDIPRARVGLMTSLPIYWEDGADMASLAAGKGEVPWARETLEERYDLQPLDSLTTETGPGLDQFERLIVAQPRAITPEDNVALDNWVTEGGHLLLVIDPLLTGTYAVPFGDPSHPMSVGLVPPVLERWGLGIAYDERQPFAVRRVNANGIELPIAMAGEVHLLSKGSGQCSVSENGVLAQCKVGLGRVTLLADAALFEFHQEASGNSKALSMLAELAFE